MILLGIAVASCQKANDGLVNVTQPVNAVQLQFIGPDSVDIADALKSSHPTLTLSDSFVVTLSSMSSFSYLQVQVQDDSGNVLYQNSFPSASANTVGGSFSYTSTGVDVGALNYTFTPFDNAGTAGNFIGRTVVLYNSAANPPIIDSVSVPDSVRVDSTNATLFDLYAYVYDKYGISDVKTVYFNSTLPNGSQSSGNPFLMNGPASIGQNSGTYSLRIQLPPLTASPPPQLGTFTFTFYAVNRSGISSSPLIHKITVYK